MSSRIIPIASLLVFASGLAASAVPLEAVNERKASAPLIAPASNEGLNAIKSFKVDPGLKIELWAAEPLVVNPVSFAQDEQGRWYVAETFRQERGIEDNRAHGKWLADDIASRTVEDRLAMIHKFYPDPKKFAEKFTAYEERVVRLEDAHGAGHADQSVVFADGFKDPLDGTGAGILARGQDVWWTCIPDLWHFRDDQGDGKADLREKLLTGFGVHYSFRGHDMHGLRFGPDGKLYFSIGDRGFQIQTKEGKTVAEPDTGSILRCNPDGTGFEVFATGVRNPQELAFDELGNLFTGENNSDSGDQARFTYLVEGGDCGWRMTFQYLTDRGPWNREKLWDVKEALKAKYIIPPIANLSNGPAGLTYNPGTGLSDKYRGKFFLCDFRGGAAASLLHEIAIEPDGAFFKLKERRDFLRGVLNTDAEFGNDGSLYVLDWVQGWSGAGKGRIYKITDPAANAALQAETKKLIGEGMSKRKPEELARLLGHADQRVRQAAQFELAARGPKSLPILTKAAQSGASQLARIHAIWGLGQLGNAADPHPLQALVPHLDDKDAEIRAQTARVLGDHQFAPAAARLVALLKDPAARPRQFAALGLGKIAFAPAADPLFAMLAENDDRDPILRHAAVMGLTGAAKPDQLAAKSADPSVAVRIGALLALRRLRHPAIADFLSDQDPSVVLEAARAIYDAPIDEALPALAQLSARTDLHDPNLLSRILNANYRLGKAENAVALAVFAANSAAPEAGRRVALDELMNWANPPAQDRILNLYRPLPKRGPQDAISSIAASLPLLLKDSPPGVQEMAARAAARLSIASAGDALVALATNTKAGPAPRVAAIQALAALKDRRLPQVAHAAITDKDALVRTQGVQALSGADPAAAVKLIAEVVSSGQLAERQGALTTLARIKRPEAVTLLAGYLDRLIAGGAPPEIELDILEAARRADAPQLNDRLKQYEASLPAGDPLAAYRVALNGGNVSRGRRIFRDKAETQCIRCHKCETGDSQVGPELTHIGSKRDRIYLLESIVYPNKHIAEGFETVALTLKDNSSVVGRLLKADPASLQLETMDDKGKQKPVTIPTAEIQTRTSAPSPMPETIRDYLTKPELRDLVEYLATRK